MLVRHPQANVSRDRQRRTDTAVWWSTAVLGIFLAALLTWLLPQATGMALVGLWLLGGALAMLSSGLLSLHRLGVQPQWGLLLLGQGVGVTAVFLLLLAA